MAEKSWREQATERLGAMTSLTAAGLGLDAEAKIDRSKLSFWKNAREGGGDK